MADLVLLTLTVGFFALMALLVRACDHIIGPDSTTTGRGAVTDGEPADAERGPAVGARS